MSKPDFGAGDLVVCVDDGPHVWEGRTYPCPAVRGRAYRAEQVFWEPNTGEWGVLLVGFRSDALTGGFRCRRFRKIDKADDSFMETLAACKPKEITR